LRGEKEKKLENVQLEYMSEKKRGLEEIKEKFNQLSK
jgi:hypothetical protein